MSKRTHANEMGVEVKCHGVKAHMFIEVDQQARKMFCSMFSVKYKTT
jgi:hypothetical protein